MLRFWKKLRETLTPAELRRLYLMHGAIILMAVLEVVGIASIMPFMRLVSKPGVIQEHAFTRWLYEQGGFTTERSFLFAMGALVLVLLSVGKLTTAWTKWIQNKWVWNSAHSMVERLLHTYLFQPYSFFLTNEPSRLVKQVISEVHQLVREVLLPLVKLTAQLVVALIIFGLLLVVDPKLAFTVMIILGGAYTVIFLSARKYLARLGERRYRIVRMRFKAAQEMFGGIKNVKIRGSETYFAERFLLADSRYANIQPRYAVVAETPQNFVEILAFGGILVIILYLLTTEQSLENVIPLLSLYALAGFRLLPSMQQIFNSASMLRFNQRLLDAIHKDLTTSRPVDPALLGPPPPRIPFEEEITFDDVSFAYPSSEEPVIKNISLAIPSRSRVAFVGSTGSGKTTMVDLLLGLHEPTSGQIRVDGVPIVHQNVRGWQQNAGYVPQEVVLFDDTITRNIVFGVPDDKIDMERVVEVARMARLHQFIIDELPEGYDTRVGEQGVRLSGGQRQRIGLARALYNDPRLLVLDEATSALDGITEEAVMQAIEEAGRDITIVMIAHRLATVRNCDHIYLLDHGRIADEGTYEELIETNAIFRGMARAAS